MYKICTYNFGCRSKVAGYEVTERKNVAFIDFISRSAFDMFTAVMYGESPQTTDSRVDDPTDTEFMQASQTAFDLTVEKYLQIPWQKYLGPIPTNHSKSTWTKYLT